MNSDRGTETMPSPGPIPVRGYAVTLALGAFLILLGSLLPA